jgi:hypothetical protein
MKYAAVYVSVWSWSPVIRQPSRLNVSPSSHSARNHGLRPSTEPLRKLRTNCGSCATSQHAMLNIPNAKPTASARSYTQSPNPTRIHSTASSRAHAQAPEEADIPRDVPRSAPRTPRGLGTGGREGGETLFSTPRVKNFRTSLEVTGLAV